MSEMVERVAQAIYASVDCAPDDPWETAPDEVKDCCRKDARAAIEAMREPTEGMVEAGAAHTYERIDAPDAYRAMITEALK